MTRTRLKDGSEPDTLRPCLSQIQFVSALHLLALAWLATIKLENLTKTSGAQNRVTSQKDFLDIYYFEAGLCQADNLMDCPRN
jgi:hypothetical protein